MKPVLKKIIKGAGILLTVAALCFVVKRVAGIDFDLSVLLGPRQLAFIALAFATQCAILVFAAYPWKELAGMISGVRVPFGAAAMVYTKANIYKYVPGNMFQYVARNQLAVDCGISHGAVASATVLDLGLGLVVSILAAVCCLGKTAVEYLPKVLGSKLIIFAVLALAAAAAVLAVVFRKKLGAFFAKLRQCLTGANLRRLALVLLYYVGNNAAAAAVFFAVAAGVVGCAIRPGDIAAVAGAYILSYLAGLVTPGAPGGLGVREAAMLVLAGGFIGGNTLAAAMVVLRLVAIAADVVVFLGRAALPLIRRSGTKHNQPSAPDEGENLRK